ncbi:Nucleolar protein 56 OS=Schizosaccharomyces pombe (strain 972 / ATCC 24843) GN=nop56 PE=3 SV=1 [Rhizoctonia solani AG-1 IB]|uniref:Nucleolar protein 56 n=2 Tax=Thanatephorus cucumeris (strain AG1-IB / isolate 7/3/14) TaxID=1108050 RepID=A0A0B7G207_THACB|nr:Nucleolar protein 56 OS=Schizosaccharomyces pombe (strain 972 / ATCC 24843) GN=nop56 PE=3 SV=1 [Rhizoctonia solani AG-1 IB]
MVTHVLFESASGYGLFSVKQQEVIGSKTKEVQDSIQDLHKFGKMVELKSFMPFKSAAHALENINDVSEGVCNDYLKNMLELNLPKHSKKAPVVLGVSEKNLAGSIVATLSIECDTSEKSLELIRGVRLHAEKLLKGLETGDVSKAQLGLGHSYSRAKVKFNVNRSDNMIIQAIALLDQLDKDVNTNAMRTREWYGWHFPELAKLVPDSLQYAKCARLIGSKESLTENNIPELAAILDDDETRAKNVLDAARTSMGQDIAEIDLINISTFTDRVIELAEYRQSLTGYLTEKMNLVAPSLTSLIGERVGARLISHAGSLTNLSKYPASTVQILGAEKALFRALKTKGNTPKYGLIYHSSFIGRAGAKHKGRISRYLANKCSIASRIDCFSDVPTAKFGDALRAQVEERLKFFETGEAPTKNSEAMRKVLESIGMDEDDDDSDEEMSPVETAPVVPGEMASPAKKEKKKRKAEEAMDLDESEEPPAKVKKSKEDKKKDKEERKKEKEKKRKAAEVEETEEAPVEVEETPVKVKKSKDKDPEAKLKKKKSKSKLVEAE